MEEKNKNKLNEKHPFKEWINYIGVIAVIFIDAFIYLKASRFIFLIILFITILILTGALLSDHKNKNYFLLIWKFAWAKRFPFLLCLVILFLSYCYFLGDCSFITHNQNNRNDGYEEVIKDSINEKSPKTKAIKYDSILKGKKSKPIETQEAYFLFGKYCNDNQKWDLEAINGLDSYNSSNIYSIVEQSKKISRPKNLLREIPQNMNSQDILGRRLNEKELVTILSIEKGFTENNCDYYWAKIKINK